MNINYNAGTASVSSKLEADSSFGIVSFVKAQSSTHGTGPREVVMTM